MRGLSARMAIASAALAAVLGTVLVVLIVAIDRQREAAQAARRSQATLADLAALRSTVIDLETGLRGFVIAGQPRYLEPFRRARRALPRQTARLERELAARPRELALLARIRAGATDYLRSYAEPLVRAVLGEQRTVSPGIGIDEGRQRVETLRGLLDRLTRMQAALAADQRGRADAQASRAIRIGAAGLAVSVALVALFALYLSRMVAAPIRRIAQTARTLAGGNLSARVPAIRHGGEVAELGRAFNVMAASLEDQQGRLEQQRAELSQNVARLQGEKARIARYGAFGRRIATQTDRDELARTIVTELAALSGAPRAVLFAAEEEDDWPEPLAAVGADDPPELSSTSPAGRALGGGGLTETEAGDPERLFAHGGAELAVPLVHAGATLGLVVLSWDGERPHTPGLEDELADLLPAAAATLSNVIALASARRRASVIRAVLDSTPDAIALLDSSGRPVLENPPMREVRLALADSVRGPGGGGGYRTRVQPGARRDGEVRDELELLGPGRTFARYFAPVRTDSGEVVGRLVVLREVTAERAADKMKDEFFALVSHELRTPLTSVIGYLELVLDDEEGELGAAHRRHLEIVQRNATRLLRLVGDLLFVAQVEAGNLSLESGPVDLAGVAAEAVEAARPRAEARSIALEAHIDDPGTAWGDRDRLGQVLDNLVANALKFTPPDGRVTVRLGRENGRAVLEVADTGPGIPEDEQERLFERFFRSESAVREAVPGVGLGLTIVKAITEAHGGTVRVASAEGAGTTFRVELPARGG